MTDVKPGARRRKAEATRRKILHAAHEEFLRSGFHGATMTAIAKRAGVAVQTVYFVFHTKPELISAVIDAAVLGDEPTPPEETDWWKAMEAEADPATALRIFVRGAAPLFARATPISEVLRAAALADEEVRRTHEHHEEMRYAAYRRIVEMLARKGRLPDGLDIDSATDVFFTIFGDAVYFQLTAERGWNQQRVVDWLCAILPTLLLDSDD
ncbi:MAG: TetR/AcrR family transcriptional regulator [Gaiellales bacterium]